MHQFGGRTFLQSLVGLVLGCNTFLFLAPRRCHVGVSPNARVCFSSWGPTVVMLSLSSLVQNIDSWYNSNPIFSFSHNWHGGGLLTCLVPGLLYDRELQWRSIYFWLITPRPSALGIFPLPLVVKTMTHCTITGRLFKPPCILQRALSSTLSSNQRTAQIHLTKRHLLTCATRLHDLINRWTHTERRKARCTVAEA
jgi:hypothetical protein